METTGDMTEWGYKVNNCLEDAIIEEIKKGFLPTNHAEIINHLKMLRKGTFLLNGDIYIINKYCYGSCGTQGLVLPYGDEIDTLKTILEKMVY